MYKNNQLWNRYFPRSQRISYRYRETPWCPSIYFIDLNQLLLLFLLTITKQKYFSSSPKLFFLLHCLWIYPAPCGSTSVLRELYCYDLLHLGVSKQFWRRCWGVAACSDAIFESKAQPVEILLLVTSFHIFSPYFLFIFLFVFNYFIWLAFIVAWAFGLEMWETD